MPTRRHNNTDFISIFRSFMLFHPIYSTTYLLIYLRKSLYILWCEYLTCITLNCVDLTHIPRIVSRPDTDYTFICRASLSMSWSASPISPVLCVCKLRLTSVNAVVESIFSSWRSGNESSKAFRLDSKLHIHFSFLSMPRMSVPWCWRLAYFASAK